MVMKQNGNTLPAKIGPLPSINLVMAGNCKVGCTKSTPTPSRMSVPGGRAAQARRIGEKLRWGSPTNRIGRGVSIVRGDRSFGVPEEPEGAPRTLDPAQARPGMVVREAPGGALQAFDK